MIRDVMFYRWVTMLVLGTHRATLREVEPALGFTCAGITRHGYRRCEQQDRNTPAFWRSHHFLFSRLRASTEESQQLSQRTVALSSVARSPVGRPPASASGKLYGAAIPERSSP